MPVSKFRKWWYSLNWANVLFLVACLAFVYAFGHMAILSIEESIEFGTFEEKLK